MALLRIPEECWSALVRHCTSSPGEHFAFFRAHITCSRREAVLIVHDLVPVPDDAVTCDETGWEVSLDALLSVVNSVVGTQDVLVEVHNHAGGAPGFSGLDREGIAEMTRFIFESLPSRPYAAMVLAGDEAYAECFFPGGARHVFDRITVTGVCPHPVARTDQTRTLDPVFDRQLPWFSREGQARLARLRVGIAGLGGTGSHVAQQLAYLGVRNFLLVDPDRVEVTNLNRLVTAQHADLAMHKVDAARRTIRAIAPDATVHVCAEDIRTRTSLDPLRGIDILFGCVDNDGARLVLNELALAYDIPYFDLATGIDIEQGRVARAGGRVAIVAPGHPCLACMGEIDAAEAQYFLEPVERQEEARRRGYVGGVDAPGPAVVSLNGAVASAAINEFAVLSSRLRPHTPFLELDILGTTMTPSPSVVTRHVATKPSCVECAKAGQGDEAKIELADTVQREQAGEP